MANFKTNTDRMNADVENIKGLTDRIYQKYNNLLKALAELDGMWDGEASEAFKSVYKEDTAALLMMITNLQKISQYENTAKEKYCSCEQQVANVIADI